MKRASILVPSLAGAIIGWLGAALAFLTGFREELLTVFIALSLLYAVVGWELRWWTELRLRLPAAIFGGGFLAGMLCPAVARRIDFQQMDIPWLLNPFGPLDIVIYTLIGALFFVTVVAIVAPMASANSKNTT